MTDSTPAPYVAQPAAVPGPLRNLFTVDVEDYFHVAAFASIVPASTWDRYPSRVVDNTLRLLDLVGEAGVRGTFFVLGWVAERQPQLVRRIAEAGHELGSHSYWHRLVYDLTPEEFREDLRRARTAIEQAAGLPVRGFRASTWTIVARSLWALDVLIEEGYAYDSSIFPMRHDLYGLPSAPRRPHVVTRAGGRILEIPASVAHGGPLPLPIGGGYFRLLPYAATRWAIDRLNATERQPAVFYIHPWEIDPDQPRMNGAPLRSRLRHYNGLARTERRLRRVLRDFQWDAIEAVCPVAPAADWTSTAVAR
jgi:polysaccharide deacetylase family protein (PEP-CTERM system associated)